jgi:hypothetical protein
LIVARLGLSALRRQHDGAGEFGAYAYRGVAVVSQVPRSICRIWPHEFYWFRTPHHLSMPTARVAATDCRIACRYHRHFSDVLGRHDGRVVKKA